MTTPEPTGQIALCPYCNTMKWPSHQETCPERPTPEPELKMLCSNCLHVESTHRRDSCTAKDCHCSGFFTPEPKKLIARRGDLRREVDRMVRKWFGEPVLVIEDELVDFITAEINREKQSWKNQS